MTRHLAFPATLLVLACASGGGGGGGDDDARLDIREPPAGSLSPERLAAVADDVRRLEARPLADGAEEGRQTLMRWLLVTPDVRVTLCGAFVGPLTSGSHPHADAFVAQFTLSGAAHKIENPRANQAAMNMSGVVGALAVYQAARARGAPEHAFMEDIARLRAEGSLRDFVWETSDQC